MVHTVIRANRPLALSGTRNTRELGGYATADGKITRTHAFLRSDGLSRLTDADLHKLLDYGVGCVVDLRSQTEIDQAPSRLAGVPGVDYCEVHMLDQAASRNFAGDMPAHMGEVYVQLLADHSREFARVFRIFAAHRDVTVLFNCAAGKDRTGVTAMLLLLLAGVPEETVVADYVPSESNMKELFALQRQQLARAGQPVPPMSVFSSAPEEIRMALDYLQQHYAGAEDYLLQAGVSPAEIAILREMLLGRGE